MGGMGMMGMGSPRKKVSPEESWVAREGDELVPDTDDIEACHLGPLT